MKELICIVCPKGCRLKVSGDGGQVAGNSCPRGEAYGRAEAVHPTRVLTTTVRVTGAAHPRCPVKTAAPIPKGLLTAAMAALDGVELASPVRTGQLVLADVCGTGVDVVATRDL